MIDQVKLEKDFQEIALLRNQLDEVGYDSEDYDDLEEALHDKEDDFQEEFGGYLEEVLHDVHDEFCPDNDVLLPIAYMAKKYVVTEDQLFTVTTKDGVFVDADDYPGNNTRLVLIPKPTRLVLIVDKANTQVVWTLGD